jgi:hypothetical protein
MKKICKVCKKERYLVNEYVCLPCYEELRNSFIYGIGGKTISKETYDKIIERGYIIPEELDEDRI